MSERCVEAYRTMHIVLLTWPVCTTSVVSLAFLPAIRASMTERSATASVRTSGVYPKRTPRVNRALRSACSGDRGEVRGFVRGGEKTLIVTNHSRQTWSTRRVALDRLYREVPRRPEQQTGLISFIRGHQEPRNKGHLIRQHDQDSGGTPCVLEQPFALAGFVVRPYDDLEKRKFIPKDELATYIELRGIV